MLICCLEVNALTPPPFSQPFRFIWRKTIAEKNDFHLYFIQIRKFKFRTLYRDEFFLLKNIFFIIQVSTEILFLYCFINFISTRDWSRKRMHKLVGWFQKRNWRWRVWPIIYLFIEYKVEVVNLVPKIVEKSKNVSFVDYSSSGGINCLSYFSCQKKEKKKKKGNRLQMSSSGSRWKCKSDLIYAYNTRRERNEKLACFHFSQICDVFLALYKPFFFF